MRRRKRKKIKFNVLIFIFVISLFSFSLGYSLLEERLAVTGKGSLVYEEDDNSAGDFKYSAIENKWESNDKTAKQYNFTIQNIKSTPFIGWYGTIELEEGDTIQNCWNVICTLEGNVLKLKNESYNANVPLEGEVTFGLIILHVNPDGTTKNPKFYGIADEAEIPEDENNSSPTSNIEITIGKGNSWESETGYVHIINVTVKNSSDTAINSWQVDFVREENWSIDNVSSANYIEMTDVLRFSNVDWNGYIAPGESTVFQFFLKKLGNSANVVVSQASGSG